MAFAPSASWNSRSITHLANYPSPSLPMIFSDESEKKNEITQQLFALVERHVKPIYEREESQQKKGGINRSETLDKRVKDALKVLNQFNFDETDEDDGEGDGKSH